MSSLKDALEKKKGDSTPLLKGSVLPRKQDTIMLNVTGVREAPENFNSPALMDFEPVTIDGVEYGAVPLNKMNAKALMGFVADTELDSIQGTATFQRILVTNPKTKALTQGLQLIAFERARSKAAGKTKAGNWPASRRGTKNVAKDDDEVPF